MRRLLESPGRSCSIPVVQDETAGFFNRCGMDWSLDHVDESHPARLEAQAFIQDAYRRAFEAELHAFYPSIVTLRDREMRLLGALGARWAEGQALFLEHYLDRPVDRLIAAHSGRETTRDAIVELGSLALGRPLVTHAFMSLIGAWLEAFEVRWLVCALTDTLRRLFHRAGVELLDLAPALPERLGEQAMSWGSYYRHDPRIVAIDLAPSLYRFNETLGLPYGIPRANRRGES